MSANWLCHLCGQRGHRKTACKNDPNPELVDQEVKAYRRRKTAEWRAANPEKNKESSRKSGAKKRQNPDFREMARQRSAAWREKEENRIKGIETAAAWREANPERAHKTTTISRWKFCGVVHDDFEQLYDAYMQATNCEDCGTTFSYKGDTLWRCLDHCHETGVFRAFVCNGCNTRRGFADRKKAKSPQECSPTPE